MASDDLSSNSYDQLLSQLQRLEDRHSLASIDEQLRLDPLISDLKHLLIKRCQQEASRLRANNAYGAAIEKWREIKSYQLKHPEVEKEIAELTYLMQQQNKIIQWNKQLCRFQALRPIFKELSAALKQVENTVSYQTLNEQVEELLLGAEPDIEGFLYWWSCAYQNSAVPNSVDLALLAERIKRGEIVLFIGSGLSSLTEDDSNLASKLAEQMGYHTFTGSLSSIAELYHLRPEFGQAALLRNLHAQFQQTNSPLYQSLALVPQALILISAAYDNGLEQAFAATGKPYVEVSSIVKRSEDYDIGHVFIRFSDNSEAARTIPEEDLSKLRLLEKNYSLIYKIRGTCSANLALSQDDARHDALTLSESSYFNFARYADRIIPNYLARQWRNRGLLFIAYRAKDWEDRLLASALLEKRSAQEPCYVIGASPEPLEQAYWESRHVKQYQVKLPDLERCLAEAQL